VQHFASPRVFFPSFDSLVARIDRRRILAAALSLALASGLLVLLKSAHPPAGAATLIISLRIVPNLGCPPRLAGDPHPIARLASTIRFG